MTKLRAWLKDLVVGDDIISAVSGTEVEPPFYDKDRKQRAQIYTTVGYVVILGLGIILSGLLVKPPVEERWDPPALIFTMEPGPGGGGGGDGTDEPLSLQQIAGEDEAQVAVQTETPEDELIYDDPDIPNPPEEEEIETDAPEIDAPVVAQAPDDVSSLGALEGATNVAANAGPGTGGGIGEGDGDGLGPGTGGGFGGGAYRMGSGITPPMLLKRVDPDYTDEAVRKKVQGVVLLEVVILPEGKIGPVRVLKGLSAGLNQAAIDCVRQWVFEPGKLKGEAVSVIAEIEVNFAIL